VNILITGGAGYIGSHVLNLLSKQTDHKLFVYDNLSTGRKESVVAGELIQADLEELRTLEATITDKEIDAVFHFAGSIVVPESVSNPLKYYKNNTLNTLSLIDLCIKHKVNRFIFSSTAAVYGIPEDGVGRVGDPTYPINPYGSTKLMTEQMLKDVGAAYPDFKSIILRYFNVAGAAVDGSVGQCTPNATHLLKIACQTALGKRNKMEIFGDDYDTPDGTCIRDYIHVDDLAQAHIDGLNYLNEGGTSEIFNVGYGKGYSVKEVLTAAKKVTDIDFNTEIAPRRDGDAPVLISEAMEIKDKLSWKPKNDDLNLLIKTAVEWESKLQ
jgi:UDP-glucose 4-epimerase